MDNRRRASRQNHYVPVWYQRGFLQNGEQGFFLDLSPPVLRPDGAEVPRAPVRRSPKSCFWAQDLYVTRFGEELNDEVETVLFAGIDDQGAGSVRAFIDGDVARIHGAYEPFFAYMGAQKLRTPKGLDWIRGRYPALSQVELMVELQHLRHLYGTLWAESVREIVSAEGSGVKFIVSDHPVATFNPLWPPTSPAQGPGREAPVALNGTQTVFALDANHCLVLTHLAYAKDPAHCVLNQPRENARSFAPTLIRTDAFIRSRRLDADGVRVINHLLKSQSRQYVAAGQAEWLYPEQAGPVDVAAISRILRPPQEGLFHFGGEVYIGYNDGGFGYHDSFGRRSRAHEFVAKTPPSSEPDDDEPCPCGEGWSFAECCKPRPVAERMPWDVMGLRERNLALLRAVKGILGLDAGKEWDDVRRHLSDDEVARVYRFVSSIWPEDSDLAALLPRPDPKRLRAVYMGLSDPRTVARSVIGLIPLFDEIFVLSPFANGVHIRPEYNPVSSPSAYRTELLKHVFFLLMLEPFIESGHVILFPDPGDMTAGFRESMRAMAQERTVRWRFERRHMAEFEQLQRDDFQRTLTGLPDDVLRSLARQAVPSASEQLQDGFVRGMRAKQAGDPLALIQLTPSDDEGGKLVSLRFTNLELTLFIAQLTGSVVVTDVAALWEHLHVHTRARDRAGAGDEGTGQGHIEFNARLDVEGAFCASDSEAAHEARKILGQLCQQASDGDVDVAALIALINTALARLPAVEEGADAGSVAERYQLAVSIPAHGFESPTVQRLVVSFGREDAPTSVPLALYRAWGG